MISERKFVFDFVTNLIMFYLITGISDCLVKESRNLASILFIHIRESDLRVEKPFLGNFYVEKANYNKL